MPGKDWALNFLKTHPELTNRFATNIKKLRAAIDETTLTCYLNNLRKVIEGVPPKNIWNCNASILTDNPGQKKVVKRGSEVPRTHL
jgi:hypothetical protein